MTDLDRLLDAIHPDQTYLPLARLVDEAVNTFPVASASVRDEEGFRNLLVRYFVHIDGIALGNRRAWIHPGLDWARCSELLERAYGRDGLRLAVSRAVYGVDGGLRRVLADVAAAYAETGSENCVAARVAAFWNPMPAGRRFAAVAEYRQKWGHLLPGDVLAGGEARMLVLFPRFLQEHPKMLRALGRPGRR